MILPIYQFPDSVLRLTAKPIETVDDSIKMLAQNMLETMYEAPGIGLAAPQVGVSKRLIVVDVSEDKSEPLIFINPEIIASSGSAECKEGCLSVPDIYEMVTRPSHIRLKALDQQGTPIEIVADDLLAVCIQHEIDHLNGKLFIDYLSPLKKKIAIERLTKLKKQMMKSKQL